MSLGELEYKFKNEWVTMAHLLSNLRSSFAAMSRTRRIIVIVLLAALLPLGYSTYRVFTTHQQTEAFATPPDEIKGKIITLRALKEAYFLDYHNMFSVDIRKGLEFPEHITLGYTIRYLQNELRQVAAGTLMSYCIFDNKDNKLIGFINLRDKNPEDPGQLGYGLHEAYRGGGRIQEAIKLLSDVYFKVKPHEKSYIVHIRLWNKRSYYAAKKAGLQDVGFFYEAGKPTRYLLEMKRP